jgi:putative metallohydrolase (TIGR04338 family)
MRISFLKSLRLPGAAGKGAARTPRSTRAARERPPRPRDSQRARAYRAESVLPEGRALPTLIALQRYVDGVTGSPLWRRLAPNRPRVEVRDGRGRRRAGSYIGLPAIAIPHVHRRERHVLHELAHQAAEAGGAPGEPAHGWRFAACLLLLMEAFQSAEAATALRDSYVANRVRFRPQEAEETTAGGRADVAAAGGPDRAPGAAGGSESHAPTWRQSRQQARPPVRAHQGELREPRRLRERVRRASRPNGE